MINLFLIYKIFLIKIDQLFHIIFHISHHLN